jgi:hypothetical protein
VGALDSFKEKTIVFNCTRSQGWRTQTKRLSNVTYPERAKKQIGIVCRRMHEKNLPVDD